MKELIVLILCLILISCQSHESEKLSVYLNTGPTSDYYEEKERARLQRLIEFKKQEVSMWCDIEILKREASLLISKKYPDYEETEVIFDIDANFIVLYYSLPTNYSGGTPIVYFDKESCSVLEVSHQQ